MATIDGTYHVYDMVPGRSNLYNTTTSELTRKFGVDYGPDVAKSLKNEMWVTYPMPSMMSMPMLVDSAGVSRPMKRDELDFIQEKCLGGMLTQALTNQEKVKNNMGKAYADIYGQCSPGIMQVASSHKDFKMAEAECDKVKLLVILKEIYNKLGDEVLPLRPFH